MGHGAKAVYPVTMTSAATLTNAANFQRGWARVYLEIKSIATNSQLGFHGSTDGTTYRPIYFDSLNSSTVGTNRYWIASSATGFVPAPPGFQYMKVESTMAVADGATFNFVCSDES